VLVGAPLGVKAHRGGLGVGAGFSIAFFVVYYLFLIGGEKLADRGYLPPAVAMWAANVLMGALGVHMLVRLTRETTFFRLPRFGRAAGKHV
jgi:lipopolysaccharide export system permease protein